MAKRLLLITEFFLLFAGMPLLILAEKNRGLLILTLWLGALVIWLALQKFYKRAHAAEWNWLGFRSGLRRVLCRFILLAPVITGLAWWLAPDNFLVVPLERTELWLRIMLLYPLLSGWPQEIIYRSFLYHRYAPLWGNGTGFIAASALAFGFMHIIFLNSVAVIMTIIGGYLFASDYARHRSLGLACLEHSLYGCLIFTVGLGHYFYSGAAWN